MAKCNKCEIAFKPDDTTPDVTCKSCGLYWHVACTALRTKPRDPSIWQCTPCKASNIRKIMQESFSTPINNVDILNSIKDLRLEMNSIKKDLHAGEFLDSLKNRITAAETKLLGLEGISKQIESLQKRVVDLEERNLTLDQANRILNLEFHGLPEYPQENLPQTLVRIGKIAGVNITEVDLKWIGRVGSKAYAILKPRIVLVKFHNQNLKNTLLRTLRNRRGIKLQELGYPDGTKTVYVSENLTPHFKDIYRSARKLGKFKFVWTYNCRVFIRVNENTELVHIKSKSQLETPI